MFSLFVLFFILLCGSAFFSCTETALFSLSRVQVHRFREAKGHFAAKLVECLRMPRHTLVTILLGNELVNISMSIVGAAIVSRTVSLGVHTESIVAVCLITPIILIFGEMLPKNIALRFSAQLAPILAVPIHLFYHAVTPVRRLLSWIADRMVSLVGGESAEGGPMIMEEEFRRLVDLGSKRGVIVEEEREIIHNVFAFTDKTAGDIMTKASELFALPIDLPYEGVMAAIREHPFSRVPFYEGEPANIVGILHVRELFTFHLHRQMQKGGELAALLRRPVFVAGATPLEELLKEFQRTQMHMALVVDARGVLAGVVTMHDVQEELFGEMTGEGA
jgi:putative hemolysin